MDIGKFLQELKQNITDALTKPVPTARRLAKSTDLKYGIEVVITSLLIMSLINFIVSFVNTIYKLLSGSSTFVEIGIFMVGYIVALIIVILLGLIFSLIFTGIVWWVGKLLGGKSRFENFYGSIQVPNAGIIILFYITTGILNLFSMFVSAAFRWIGVETLTSLILFLTGIVTLLLVLIAGLGRIYYNTIFVKEIHEISTIRALISVCTPIIVAIGLVLMVIVFIIAILGIGMLSLDRIGGGMLGKGMI